MATESFGTEVDWLREYSYWARKQGMTVSGDALQALGMEIELKNRLNIPSGQFRSAIRALAEDAAKEAKADGRTEIASNHLRKALDKCRVYPFCD